MTIRYNHSSRGPVPYYLCQHSSKEHGGKVCQTLSGATVDPAIGQLVVEAMTPATIAVALEVFEELRRRHEEADVLHRSRIDRARQEAELAQRQFLLANPENRLVTDTLEQRWNDKLRDLAAAEDTHVQWKQQEAAPLDSSTQQRVVDLARNFPAVWNHPKTSQRERKRMLRLL